MNLNRKKAIVVGILILFAYAVLASAVVDSKIIVMISEIISGLAVIGIAVILFPFFKSYNKNLSFGYLAFRFLEGSLMVVTGFLFLSSNAALLDLRDSIYIAHTYIFIIAAFFFYYLLYLSKLIPRWLAVWGIVAAILLLIANLLELMHAAPPIIILYLPIISNEVVLALYFIFKGFNLSNTESAEAK